MDGTKAAPQAGDRTHPGIRLPNRESETARSELEANARLIAAAPEMLEALKQATDQLDGYIGDQEAQLEGHPEYKRRHLYETQRVRDNLCAAIAKAEHGRAAP